MPVWPVATRWRPKSTADRGLPRLNEQYDLYQRTNWLRGLEATYTEHGSTTREKPGNRSKSGARNRLDLQLQELLATILPT